MNRFRIFVLLAMAAAFPARAVEEKSMPHAEADPLVVDAAMQEQLGIATAIVATQIQTAEIQAPGEVKANAYATVVVSPRVAAQVVRRQAKLGDAVTAGQPLVTLSSVEVAEAQGALIVAEREWQRVKTLGADAVSAKRYTEAQVARDQANAKLRAFGLGSVEVSALLRAGSSRANGDFLLLAPQAGRVATDDFVVGERVEPGKPLFTLIDESRVWVEAQMTPAALEGVAADAQARIVAHGRSVEGKVIQRSHRTQEATRTSFVRVEVPNADDLFHAGEFVETFIASNGSETVLAVPTEAIAQLQGQSVVFKLAAENRFEVAPVETGATRGTTTRVTKGLSEGDRIAVKGAYALKARLLKSQLGEGHAD